MDAQTRKTRIAATFTHAKETENTYQYKEDGAPKRIGTIYLKKRFLKKCAG